MWAAHAGQGLGFRETLEASRRQQVESNHLLVASPELCVLSKGEEATAFRRIHYEIVRLRRREVLPFGRLREATAFLRCGALALTSS